jgi:HTH-type transcriptional regulator/antitoxin HigA
VSDREPAECFPPGEFIREEMEARGWSEAQLADMVKWNRIVLDQVLSGNLVLTEQMAADLERGFKVSQRFWLNLETSYRVWLRKQVRPVR